MTTRGNINRIHQKVIDEWNASADEYNQWDNLGGEEKIEWAIKVTLNYGPSRETEKLKASSQPNIQNLINALEAIREKAMEHPMFWDEAFEARDIDGLINEGGDCCDWTMIAIEADDALKGH